MKQINELLETGIYESFIPERQMTVADFLDEKGLSELIDTFGVLVNGSKASLDTVIGKKDEIVVIPNIAGG